MYVDTSILFPCYIPEPRSAEAQKVVYSASAVYVSELALAEMEVIFARKVKIKNVKERIAEGAFRTFQQHLRQGRYEILPFRTLKIKGLHAWAASLPIPLKTLDALHLWWARAKNLSLATFDPRLVEAAQAIG